MTWIYQTLAPWAVPSSKIVRIDHYLYYVLLKHEKYMDAFLFYEIRVNFPWWIFFICQGRINQLSKIASILPATFGDVMKGQLIYLDLIFRLHSCNFETNITGLGLHKHRNFCHEQVYSLWNFSLLFNDVRRQ